jgi:hypothetical protein
MSDRSEVPLPAPSATLSVFKVVILAAFLMLSAEAQAKFIKLLRVVSSIFLGSVKEWPLDFGRPLSQAEEVIASNRSAAAWAARFADQLELVKGLLPR